MKKLLLAIVVAILGITGVNAQRSIIIQNNDKVFESMKIATIIDNTEDGDTIYLPGGPIVLTGYWDIDKEVHIIGAGHYPDSTRATFETKISGGHIRFMQGSDNSSITGVYQDNDIIIGSTATDSISNISITRSTMSNLYLGYTGAFRNAKNAYLNISENVIRGGIIGCDAQHILIEKNIINGRMDNFTDNAVFNNNIFYYGSSSYDVFRSCTGLVVNNNIFVRDYHGLASSVINNNLFTANYTVISGSNMGSGNIVNNQLDSLFITSESTTAFSYDKDYHLHPSCDGIGAGTDGNDVGIYGTSNPYKEGAVPFNPHIRFVNVQSETDNGLLPVEIHVGAQER